MVICSDDPESSNIVCNKIEGTEIEDQLVPTNSGINEIAVIGEEVMELFVNGEERGRVVNEGEKVEQERNRTDVEIKTPF